MLLEFARPRSGELPPSDADALESHLAGCIECDAQARADRAADARIAQAMRAVSLPAGLRDRILDRLATEQTNQQSRRLAWTARLAVAAAVVLLAVGFGITWFGSRPQPLDLEQLHAQGFARSTSPQREKVEGWFKEDFNLNTVAPSAFNYAYLKDFGLASCQGQRVPSMYFARGETEAHVYVISKDQFDLKALSESEPIESGGFHVEVHRDDPDHAFVVFYKGDSLRPLLSAEEPAQ